MKPSQKPDGPSERNEVRVDPEQLPEVKSDIPPLSIVMKCPSGSGVLFRIASIRIFSHILEHLHDFPSHKEIIISRHSFDPPIRMHEEGTNKISQFVLDSLETIARNFDEDLAQKLVKQRKLKVANISPDQKNSPPRGAKILVYSVVVEDPACENTFAIETYIKIVGRVESLIDLFLKKLRKRLSG